MSKKNDYTEVRVYKTAKNLLMISIELTKHYPREYRYTIGQDLYKSIVEFIIMIYDAYIISNFEQQAELIKNLKRQLQYINTYINIAWCNNNAVLCGGYN